MSYYKLCNKHFKNCDGGASWEYDYCCYEHRNQHYDKIYRLKYKSFFDSLNEKQKIIMINLLDEEQGEYFFWHIHDILLNNKESK